jgi:hypothetical protein
LHILPGSNKIGSGFANAIVPESKSIYTTYVAS